MNYLTTTCEFCGTPGSAMGRISILCYESKLDKKPKPELYNNDGAGYEKEYFRYSFAACPRCKPSLMSKSWREAWALHVTYAVAAALERNL